MIANDPSVLGMTSFFKCFYNGFTENTIIWFAYMDENNDFGNPVKFQLDDWQTDEYTLNSLREIIAPRILPTNFTSARGSTHGFEFYHP